MCCAALLRNQLQLVGNKRAAQQLPVAAARAGAAKLHWPCVGGVDDGDLLCCCFGCWLRPAESAAASIDHPVAVVAVMPVGANALACSRHTHTEMVGCNPLGRLAELRLLGHYMYSTV